MLTLGGKKILLGISGSIAAYKAPFLLRLLIKNGAEVKVVLTPSAMDFVTPITLSTLSKNPVNSSFTEIK
ncbi:MAG: phosphopantothenoylcysteine decarboxylase, partial [Flavobacteriaceae bacterium TMED206]